MKTFAAYFSAYFGVYLLGYIGICLLLGWASSPVPFAIGFLTSLVLAYRDASEDEAFDDYP